MGLNQYVDEPTSETVQRLLPSVALEPVLKPLSLLKDPVRQPGITDSTAGRLSICTAFSTGKAKISVRLRQFDARSTTISGIGPWRKLNSETRPRGWRTHFIEKSRNLFAAKHSPDKSAAA